MTSLNKLKQKLSSSKAEPKVKKLKRGERIAKAKANNNKSTPETKSEFKAGKEQRATEAVNCLSCMHWAKCPSKKKGRAYACTKLKLYPTKSTSAAGPPGKGPQLIGIGGKAVDRDAGLSKEERIISQMISRTLKGSGVIAADNRIDDRDMETAPNFFTWITDSKFMGTSDITPWAKQIEHPTKLYSEWCPNPKCTDIKWWADVPVDATIGEISDHVTFLEWGICPRCHTRKSEWVSKGMLNPYNALAGLAGQRSAKTATAVFGIGYDLSRLLKSQNPSAMYGLPTMQVLTGTFAALTFEQAKDNIWSFVYNMLMEAPWFKSYHALLKEQCYKLGIEDVAQITNISARYRHRNLFYHISGPNKRTMRGKTRVTAMIDEIGWFLQQLKSRAGADPERLDAKGTHEALDRSLLTVRDAAVNLLTTGANENVPMGYMYETSSPSSKTDMIMQLYEESRGSRTTYGYRMATWEANPTIKRDSTIIVEAYRKDPITAHRDYAAVPPVSGNPYVKLPSLKGLFSKRRENAGLLKTIRVTNAAGQMQTSGEIKRLKSHKGEVSVLSVDAGYVNNSFAVTVLYTSRETGRIICPFIGEIFPSPEAPIHFPHVTENVLTQLIEHFNVQLVMSDRWQSIMMLQTLCEENEVAFVTRSLKYPEFDSFRQTAIYDGGLQLPMLECKPKEAIKIAGNPGYPGTYVKQPLAHLLYQFVAVNDVPNVGVTKPDGGTDDLFRSLVLGFTGITDPEYAEFFEEGGMEHKPHIGIVMPGVGIGGGAQVSNSVGVAIGPRNSVAGSSGMGVVSTSSR